MPHLPLILIMLLTTALLSGCSTLESWQSAAEESLDSMNSWLNTNAESRTRGGRRLCAHGAAGQKSQPPL